MNDCTTALQDKHLPAESAWDSDDGSEVTATVSTTSRTRFNSVVFLSNSVTSSVEGFLEDACRVQAEAEMVFLSRFRILLEESVFEYGFTTPADQFVREAFDRYGVFVRDWIVKLFHSSYEKPEELCKILRTLAHFEYSQVSSQGALMATSALFHVHPEVQESGVRCFENWEEPSCLNILKSCQFGEAWLADYVNQVILELDEA